MSLKKNSVIISRVLGTMVITFKVMVQLHCHNLQHPHELLHANLAGLLDAAAGVIWRVASCIRLWGTPITAGLVCG